MSSPDLEEALRRSEEFAARLIESSRDCIKVLDLNGCLLSINQHGMTALEICDVGPLVGSPWVDFWAAGDKPNAQAAIDAAGQGKVGHFTGFFATAQTQTPKWWDVSVTPILDRHGKPEKLLAVSRDVTDLKVIEQRLRESQEVLNQRVVNQTSHLERTSAALRDIVEGVEAKVGAQFFPALVQQLAKALGVEYAFVSEFCADRSKVRTLAFWAIDRLWDNFEYTIAGTPCELVLAGELYHCEDGVSDRFPSHKHELDELRVQSYLAIPVTNVSGLVLGHLAVMGRKPMRVEQLDLSVFRVFGQRVGAELERLQLDARLKDNEERLRDLFDEAPIAYVNEGLDSKFIRANKTAMKTLGITPEQVAGLYGASFIPDTPDAQRRLKDAFDSVGKGIDTSGVVLELRRKDNGKPLWIKWWSRPDPGGTYTRTMFVDITDQVLMEQEKARLEAENVYLQEEIKTAHNFEEIIGTSTPIKKVMQAIEKVAATDATVLVTGETGTGKELIARAIHHLSRRKDGVLVKVNCAAIPAGLIESELFGHEKGAFTGALARKLGRFELADKATIFLDEVGEIPLELQTKLLRVLQEGEFERLGSTRTMKVNVRVIAATNRDLEQEVREGRFRSDLYYRLKVFPIPLPALRDRRQDIPLLVSYFVKKFSTAMGKTVESVSAKAMAMLKSYPWPGNIRELEHVVERAIILSQGTELDLDDWMPKNLDATAAGPAATLEEVERAHIMSVLTHTNWRVSGDKGAARILGLNPTTLEARMKKLGISRPS